MQSSRPGMAVPPPPFGFPPPGPGPMPPGPPPWMRPAPRKR
jgi:hypothetical protein